MKSWSVILVWTAGNQLFDRMRVERINPLGVTTIESKAFLGLPKRAKKRGKFGQISLKMRTFILSYLV
jgi:hypothetical protein